MLTSQLKKGLRLKHGLQFILLVGWPLAVYAVPLTFGESVSRVTPLEWFLVAFLSVLSGLTSLLMKVSNEVNGNPPRTIRHPFIYGGAHMFGALLAGVMAFFGAAQFGFVGFTIGMFVPAAAFGGAASCQWFMKKMMGSSMSVPVASAPIQGDQPG